MGTVFLLLHFQSQLSSRSKSSMVLADPHGSYAYTHIERPSYTLTQSWGGPSHFAQQYSGNSGRSFSRFNSITYGARTGGLKASNFPADTDEPTARAALNFILQENLRLRQEQRAGGRPGLHECSPVHHLRGGWQGLHR